MLAQKFTKSHFINFSQDQPACKIVCLLLILLWSPALGHCSLPRSFRHIYVTAAFSLRKHGY